MKLGLSYLLFCCSAIVYNMERAKGQVEIYFHSDRTGQPDLTEPDLNFADSKWFSFYPYANIDFLEEISGYLYDPTISGSCSYLKRSLPFASLRWIAYIEGYSTCPLETLILLEDAGCKLLLTYDYGDNNRTISGEAKDTGLPIVILSEENALNITDSHRDDFTVHRSERIRIGLFILLAFAGIFVLIIFVILLVWSIYKLRNKVRSTSSQVVELRPLGRLPVRQRTNQAEETYTSNIRRQVWSSHNRHFPS